MESLDVLSVILTGKHAKGRTGKHGGPKLDRQNKRKQKIAAASRRRNRR